MQTVEVDQWFWYLFKGNTVVLPKTKVVSEYAASVPPDFTFSIKVLNSITLTTHHYNKQKNATLIPNPYFLSTELMGEFLQNLEPLGDHIGPLMFQFEHLNKNKMTNMDHFIDMFQVVHNGLPGGYHYCIEIRNPNYFKNEYFHFLAEHHLGHVFLQEDHMPSIYELYAKFKSQLSDPVVLRLHGLDRQGIEERTNNVWDKIVDPRDGALLRLKSS